MFSTFVFPFEGRFDLDSEVTGGEGFDVDLENNTNEIRIISFK